MDRIALVVVSVVFLATVVRSAFGFGEALVAVPLLALAVPVTVAAPLAALVSITVAAVIVLRDWRHVHVGSAARLIVSTLAGIPFGLLLLTHAPEAFVKGMLAMIIIAFSLYLIGSRHPMLADERWAWCFGFAAGVLGGAYGMNGPPLAVYGSLRRWSPAQFRATLQGYFLPASVVGMGGYWLAGLWTSDVTRFYLESLPAVAVAVVLGRLAIRRVSPARFLTYVYVGLFAVGAVLLLQSATGR